MKSYSWRLNPERLSGAEIQPLVEDHLAWVWAAYRRGAFEGLEPGMAPAAWRELILSQTRALLQAGGDVFILFFKGTPIGLVAAEMNQRQAWPHVTWFPEATLRGRLECAAQFLMMIGKTINAVIVSEMRDVKFFERLCRYGLLRRIGEGHGWLNGENIVLFETVRP